MISLSHCLVCALLLANFLSCVLGCTAASHHKVIASRRSANNDVNDHDLGSAGIKSLFTFDSGPKAKKRRDLACASNDVKSSLNSDCAVVLVHPEVLAEKKVMFPLDPRDSKKYVILKKISEEGIEFLANSTVNAPTLLTFKNGGEGNEIFVAKQGIVYGSVSGLGAGFNGRFHLAPCPKQMKCQLLLFNGGAENKNKKTSVEENS